ncbi:hypothetical protein ABZ135_31300 [Streptomyces sp. NPDC006339]|uniref:hypothetical protein n=1 Tax=Streptomyces sp. NPDC006339 TaxID=3156755 RepID=UPI0033AFB1BF
MATLGDLFDTADNQLEAAARITLKTASPALRAALAEDLDGLVSRLLGVLPARPASGRRPPQKSFLVLHLEQAQASLRTVRQLLPAPDRAALGPADMGIAEATRTITTVRDLIESHRGPDRAPLTPYAHAFSSQPALDYLAMRTARLTWQVGRVAVQLAQGLGDPAVVGALEDARGSLDRASALGRQAASNADTTISAFPLALPVEPVQVTVNDATRWVTTRLSEDCERLSRVAFEALYDSAEHALSGSDLQQLSRWMSMGRLLAGRVLLRVAEQHPDDALAAGLREAAGPLRESAQAWQQAAAAWDRIVDAADPRSHPKLPPPSYAIVRRGEVVHLPQVVPHAATVIAHTSAVRIGQLLFGADWRPDKGNPGEARSGAAILRDVGGQGALGAALYRLPATGWQLAVAAPVTIQRIQPRLVTDSIERRPKNLDPRLRFYQVHPRQVEALTKAYDAVPGAEQKAAGALLRTAQAVGASVPRAGLDAAAHQMLAASRGWTGQTATPTPGPQVARPAVPAESRSGLTR